MTGCCLPGPARSIVFFRSMILSIFVLLGSASSDTGRAADVDSELLPRVRGFYLPSYDVNALVDKSNEAQLGALRAQIPSASHAVLAVHVRVHGGSNSNGVARDRISEDPGHLVPWFKLARKMGFRTGLIAILFSDDDWGWGGYWKPSDSAAALASYYAAIRPYVQAAQTASVDFVILCDEWSALFNSYAAVPAFRTLVGGARADYSGKIGINANQLEEADLLPDIAALMDFIGITAYVPLSNADDPSYENMYENLTGPSQVNEVQDLVSQKAAEWGRADVRGYMSYVRHLADLWKKPVILTTGYKSTVGAAKNPAEDRPETQVDEKVQATAWKAFINAATDQKDGAGGALYGILGWYWWPVRTPEPMGYAVQDKPAAAAIDKAWSRDGDAQ